MAKTLRSRIAAVAVAALGMGLLAATPSSAATSGTSGDLDSLTLVASSASLATGEAQTIDLKVDYGATVANSDVFKFKVTATSFPSGVNSVAVTPTGATVTQATIVTTASTSTTAVFQSTIGTAASLTAGSNKHGSIEFTPTVAGTYTFRAWSDDDEDGTVNGSEMSTTASLTITAVGEKTEFGNSTAAATADHVTAVALTKTVVSSRVGVTASITPSFKITAASGSALAAGDGAVTLRYSLTKPSGSTAALSATSQTATNTVTALASAETSAQSMTAITFTPDVAGTYTITAYHDSTRTSTLVAGDLSDTISFVVAADAPTLTIKAFNSTALAGDWDNTDATESQGALVRLTLTNGGVATTLGSNEKITVSVDAGQIELKSTSSVSTSELNATSIELVRADFDSKGRVWLNFSKSSAGTQVITFDGVGGGVDSLLMTQTITYKAAASGTYDAATLANTSGVEEATALVLAGDNGAVRVDTLKSTAVKYTVSFGAADAVGAVHVKDTSGLITGLAAAEYSSTITGASTAAGTVTYTAPAFGNETDRVAGTSNFQFAFGTTSNTDVVVVRQDSADDAAANTTLDQASAIRALIGGTITVSAVIADQFGIERANERVTISVGNRNAQVVSVNAVSDADGRVSITYKDAPLAGVVAITDTITFNQDNGTDKTVTVTWVSDLSVSKVTVTTGNTTAGVTATTVTNKTINAGSAGAQATSQSLSAKVTDANGSVLVGIPVTFTVAGTGAAILSTTATAYTDATGVATSNGVYAWIAGTYTVTAAVGAVSGTGTITFAQENAAYARVLSATVSGQTVTAKVVDRFGNPVKGVTVYATKTGVGYFGSGVSKTYGDTDKNGLVEFNVAGGAASVTVSTISYDAAAGSVGSGQTCAAKGYADCSTTAPTAFDAYVAGTSTADEEGVGATFDAAGVATVTVDVKAATDANAADIAAVKASVAALTTTITSIQTAISTLVASVTATLTSMSAQINKIMKKLKIK